MKDSSKTQMLFPMLSEREKERRWEQTRDFMRKKELGALIGLGTFNTNRLQPYLGNTGGGGVVIFPLDSEPVYLGGGWDIGINFDNARNGIKPWIADTRVTMDPIAEARKMISERGLEKSQIGIFGLSANPTPIGGTAGYPEGKQFEEAFRGIMLLDVTVEYGLLMLKKSEEEQAMVRHAAKVCESVVEAMIKECKVGALETDVYAAAVHALCKGGCDVTPNNLLMTVEPEAMGFISGPQWFYPHRQPRALKPGDIVEAEIFAWYGSQDSQAQTSILIGEPDEERIFIKNVARQAYEAGVAQIRPGVPFNSVWKAMRQVIIDGGCWAASPVAHSLSPVLLVGEMNAGLMEADVDSIFKAPAFVPGYNDENLLLEEGMVIAVEPCVGKGYKKVLTGGAVLVTENGMEELNHLSTRMQIIRC